MLEMFLNNKEWIFGGIGTSILLWLVGLFFKKRHSQQITSHQSANGSNIIQVCGNDNEVKH